MVRSYLHVSAAFTNVNGWCTSEAAAIDLAHDTQGNEEDNKTDNDHIDDSKVMTFVDSLKPNTVIAQKIRIIRLRAN